MSHPLQTRARTKDQLTRREVTLLDGRAAPASLDQEARTVEVVVATEQPVRIFDWQRGNLVDEVLLISGLKPLPGQVPFLDTHNRWSTNDVLGSLRGFKREGDQVTATAHFSRTAEKAWTLAQEGHLTDVSVGYRVLDCVWVDEGKTAKVGGKSFTGPVKVATKWEIREVSAVPIGADSLAKVRAQANHEPQEDVKMNKKLREYLEHRGLAKDASEQQAWEFLDQFTRAGEFAGTDEERQELTALMRELGQTPAAPPAPAGQRAPAAPAVPPAPGLGQDEVRALAAEMLAGERSRVQEIAALCATFEVPAEDQTRMVINGLSLDQARAKVLELVAQRHSGTQGGAGHRGPVQFGADEQDKYRAVAIDAVMLRAGLAPAQPAQGAADSPIRGYTLRELARECFMRANPTAKVPINPLELVGRALTTSDLPYILGNIANKSLLQGWETAPETWRAWMNTGSVNDFKTHTAAGLGESDDLDQIREDGEYKHSGRVEVFEQYAVVTYGKLYWISRQAIINDDLNALTLIPAQRGEAAARKVGDVAYAVLTANSAMGDGVALFATDHNNLLTGAALGHSALGAGFLAMALQKGPNNAATLNIRPQFLIAPVTLEADHEQFFNTTRIGDVTSGTIYDNQYAGSRLTRVYEPRLDDDDAAAWYLAGPRGRTITVYFLNGVETPYIESKEGWNVDGIEYKVRIDAGAKAMYWQGLAKNPGPSS